MMGDAHIYDEHRDNVLKLFTQAQNLDKMKRPKAEFRLRPLGLNKGLDEFVLTDYEHNEPIKFELKG